MCAGSHLSQQLQGDVDGGGLVFPTARPTYSLTQGVAKEDVFMRNFSSHERAPQGGVANYSYHPAKINSADSAYSSDSLRTDVSGVGGAGSPHHVPDDGEDLSVDWEVISYEPV